MWELLPPWIFKELDRSFLIEVTNQCRKATKLLRKYAFDQGPLKRNLTKALSKFPEAQSCLLSWDEIFIVLNSP